MADTGYRQLRTSRANDVFGTIGRTFSYIGKRYRFRFVAAICFTILSSLTGVISSYLFTPIINNYIVPFIGQQDPDLSGFVKMLGIMISVYAGGLISSYCFSKLMSVVSTGVLDDMRKDLFKVMERLPVRFFDSRTHGEVMNYYTNDIDTIRPMISDGFPTLITTMITIVGCFTFMFILNARLTWVMVVFFSFMFLVTYLLAKGSRRTFADLQRQISNLNGYTQEMFSGQKVIKVFNHEKQTMDGFMDYNRKLYDYSLRTNAYASVLMPINANLSYIAYAIVAVLGSRMCIDGNMRIGDLTSFMLFVRQFGGPISNLSQQFNGIMMSLAGAERVFDLMDREGELDFGIVELVNVEKDTEELIETDRKTDRWAWKIPVDPPKYIELKGDIRLNDVTFRYEEGKDILKKISLYAKPGQKIAFVGSTGAGKTTITNLINRFYDVEDQEGMITFDGIPIKEIRKDDLRRSVGVVLQDTNLFSGTIMDNIRYGRLEASDEECIAAAKISNADSFIERLPHGYQTMLSANGSNLSQGQRQLLNIARCAVADPPVMVLDEATSSIDTHTEKLIEKGMDELMSGRTTFVIAHRLSTVRNANAIIVLEHGEIIERGTHEDLLALKGRYYQLYTGKAELE
ncbi:MAG: ABC transporter ATP-binding protein/permease [Erysipelotrichaceae bacterium]|nr:ABC transporter ATP-binding protein/permease [Erysipelotrichaceae bacterium]